MGKVDANNVVVVFVSWRVEEVSEFGQQACWGVNMNFRFSLACLPTPVVNLQADKVPRRPRTLANTCMDGSCESDDI